MKLQTADFTFVFFQFVLFFLFVFEISQLRLTLPSFIQKTGIGSIFIGIIIILIALLQLNKNLSPFPTPKSTSQLITTGLYKFIRHPIYTGIMLTLLGYSLYTESGYKFLITLLLYILFSLKSRYEEKRLHIVFKNYADYKKHTGRFLPKINP